MNTIKNVFTMLMLKLIKFLLGFSSRLVPLLIIALAILKSTKIIELNSKYIIAIIVVEAILIIFNLIFNSLFFKNKEKEETNNETDNKIKEENKKFTPEKMSNSQNPEINLSRYPKYQQMIEEIDDKIENGYQFKSISNNKWQNTNF